MCEKEVAFMIELFKSVNIMEHKMTRVSIVIKSLSFDLIAYEKLWTLVRYGNDEVAKRIC